MKKLTPILLVSIFVLVNSEVSSAQWIHQNSGTTDQLFSVFFPTNDTGYVSGSSAGILKTTDGGTNWNTIPNSPIGASLFFTSRDTGHAITNDTIFKTVNGGVTWTPQYVNPALFGIGVIYFSDKLTGYTSGINNNQDTIFLIKTINGGNTWNIVSSVTNSTGFLIPFASISFISHDTGCFVGSFGPEIYRTVNGCASASPVFSSIAVLYSVQFPTRDTGYSVGYPDALVKSVNGGSTWSVLPTVSNNEFYSNVFFTTKDTGFIVSDSASFYGKILKTTDGGNTWVTQIRDTDLVAIYFPSHTVGYAVGANGTILKYTGVVGIEEIEASSFAIYPNPTSGIFTLQSKNQLSKSTITVFNSLGDIIFKSGITNQKSEINLSSQPTGIYFVKVTEGEKVVMKKIVKL